MKSKQLTGQKLNSVSKKILGIFILSESVLQVLNPTFSEGFPHYARKKSGESTASTASAEPAPSSAFAEEKEISKWIDQIETSSAAPDEAGSISKAGGSSAPDQRPVTQEQFKTLIRNYKVTLDRVKKLESQSRSKDSGDELVLGSSDSTSSTAAPAEPTFRTYFDFNLVNQPRVVPFSFDSYHAFLLFELMPTPEVQFSFDVSTSPRYFELDYQVHPMIQIRLGKIWVPFDDMSPHNIFGGRTNVSRMSVSGAPAFLPDLWTDLGVGIKVIPIDSPFATLTTHLYIVNGFGEGGRDPLDPAAKYPKLADLSIGPDTNRDKAIGGRAHVLIKGRFGLGGSLYHGRWTSDDDDSKRLTLLGADAQVRFPTTELRAGIISMIMPLLSGDLARRGGFYGEVGQKFGPKGTFKALIRGGLLQFDDRVLDTSTTTVVGDQTLVGATLLWKPNFIQYSIEHSRDLKTAPNKINYSYTAARVVIAL